MDTTSCQLVVKFVYSGLKEQHVKTKYYKDRMTVTFIDSSPVSVDTALGAVVAAVRAWGGKPSEIRVLDDGDLSNAEQLTVRLRDRFASVTTQDTHVLAAKLADAVRDKDNIPDLSLRTDKAKRKLTNYVNSVLNLQLAWPEIEPIIDSLQIHLHNR